MPFSTIILLALIVCIAIFVVRLVISVQKSKNEKFTHTFINDDDDEDDWKDRIL